MRTGFRDTYIHTRKPVKSGKGKDRRELRDTLTAIWLGIIIEALPGYKTDGASIPRFFWRLVGHPFEEYEAAAIIHDLLYDAEAMPRKEIDRCFLDLMIWLGVGRIRRTLIYSAVRVGGGPTWWKHTTESINEARMYLTINGEMVQ